MQVQMQTQAQGQAQTQVRWSSTAQASSLAPKIERGGSKVYKDADAAVADIKSGSTILSSGFGLCGVAGEFASPMGDVRNESFGRLLCY